MSQIYGYFINNCFYILSFLLASLLKRLFFCTISLFLGLISCQSQEQTFTVHCTGLDAHEGDTVYLWRYGADRMTGDRDYGKAPLDFAIIRNGEVSFSGKEDTLHIYGMEHPGSMNFFYPERGKLTLTNVVPPTMPVPDKIHKTYVFGNFGMKMIFRWKLRGNLYSTMPGTQLDGWCLIVGQ